MTDPVRMLTCRQRVVACRQLQFIDPVKGVFGLGELADTISLLGIEHERQPALAAAILNREEEVPRRERQLLWLEAVRGDSYCNARQECFCWSRAGAWTRSRCRCWCWHGRWCRRHCRHGR